jgi:TonB-linked SusC/RagA family outer membrane protein
MNKKGDAGNISLLIFCLTVSNAGGVINLNFNNPNQNKIMEKIYYDLIFGGYNIWKSKYLKKMRTVALLLLISITQTFALESYAQTQKLSINCQDETIHSILQKIENLSEFNFMFDATVIDINQRKSIVCKNKQITTILDQLLEDTEIVYVISDRQIVLSRAKIKDAVQGLTISGKVTDTSGNPLPGVTVVMKGTTQGTVTDANGEYSITNIPKEATLVFSFVGMKTREVAVAGKTSISVVMAEESIGLEEVVAIGYGSLSRNKVSSSIAKINQDKIQDQLPSSIDRTLEGRIAGMEIKTDGGSPGGGALIRIRGVSSIGGGNEPLIVIDGIPLQSSYDKLYSPLSLIDPDNIETIDILKDVSATAIYGSRGSSGVILITTKSGKVGATKVSFSAQTGVAEMLACEKLDLMNAREFATWRKENAYERASYYGYDISLDDIPEEYRDPEKLGEGTDWQDYLTRLAPQQKYNLSVTHGTEKFNGFYSLGYIDEQGVIKETGFTRFNIRANMEYTPNEVVKVALNLHPSFRWWNNYNQNLWLNTIRNTPVDGPGLDDGAFEDPRYFDGDIDTDIYSSGTFNGMNPLYALQVSTDKKTSVDVHVQPYIEIIPLKGLILKSQFNMQMGFNTDEKFSPSSIGGLNQVPPSQAVGYYGTNKNVMWQFENTINYTKTVGDHDFSALLGHSMERYHLYSSNLTGSGFPSDYVKTLNAATVLSGGTEETNWSMISYISRLNYSYKSKYLFTGTVRRDGSSRFGPDSRWGIFPSASVGWNVSKENFFPEVDWLSNFKLRASYGTSGNNAIGNYTWIPGLAIENYTFGGSIASGQKLNAIENTRLSWQESSEFDLGSDLILLGGKINLVFDYYSKITENMLWPVTMPISSGFNSMTQNIGKMRNRGVEFAISSINISKPDFSWSTDFNMSFNRNLVLDLGDVSEITGSGATTIVGQPVAMLYGYVSLGVWKDQAEIDNNPHIPNQLPGTARFADVDNSGSIDSRDQTIIGNPHPKFRGGMNNSFRYKNWDMNVSMSFAHDYDVMSKFEQFSLNLDGVFNVLKEAKNRWRSPEDPGDGRVATSIHQTAYDRDKRNTDFINNVSFLKVQNISLGYSLKNISSIDRLRLYCTLQNAFLFTNYKYGNPDVNDKGNSPVAMNMDVSDYPLQRTVVFGVNVEF